jgi:hypothetical protein
MEEDVLLGPAGEVGGGVDGDALEEVSVLGEVGG